jgi:hypothetical protein
MRIRARRVTGTVVAAALLAGPAMADVKIAFIDPLSFRATAARSPMRSPKRC